MSKKGKRIVREALPILAFATAPLVVRLFFKVLLGTDKNNLLEK